jgi:TolB protein
VKRTLCLLLLLPGLAHATLEVTVTSGESSARPIAIVPFADGEAVSAIVEADLVRSGQFRAVPARDMLERPTDVSQVEFRNWRALGVDNLVVGQLRRGTLGQLIVRFQLLDALRAQALAGFDVPVPDPARLRPVAHQIADIIYEKLIGIPGYFNSELVYVAASGKAGAQLYQIVIADSDGQNPVTVATSREPLMSPTWSPDRRQLAYVGYERGRSAIYLHTLATGELRKISSERGINGAPAFSPDGRQLAVTLSFESNADLYVIDLATGARRQLTSHYAIDTEAAWSPDGREIAFNSDRGGQPQIYVVPANGGDARRITFEGKQNLCPHYSPDGKKMVLVNSDGVSYRIGLLDLATRQLKIIGDGPLDESPSFSPNGAVVLYAAQGRQGAELATVTVDGRIRQRFRQAGDVRAPAWSSVIR